MNDPQRSKTILVTGGNAGIGLATAKALAGRGHRVIIACRNADKAKEAIRLIQDAAPNASVSFRRLDLASLDGTRRFAEAFLEDFPSLDVLINNAGIYPKTQQFSQDGYEAQIGINYLAPFLLTHLLLPALDRCGDGRIVHLSSRCITSVRSTTKAGVAARTTREPAPTLKLSLPTRCVIMNWRDACRATSLPTPCILVVLNLTSIETCRPGATRC